jgi:hypothetical protein
VLPAFPLVAYQLVNQHWLQVWASSCDFLPDQLRVKASRAAHASSNGGVIARDRLHDCVTACFMRAALAPLNSDQSNAIVPVTKGAAALVPPEVSDLSPGPRLVMFSAGAANPHLPIDLPMLDSIVGLPCKSQPITAMTHGCRVMEELPTFP